MAQLNELRFLEAVGEPSLDGRGLTPLMLAVATTRQDSAVIRMLLDRGADAAAQDNAGETAEYWARKQGVPAGLRLLKLATPPLPAPAHAMAAATATMDVKGAAERGLRWTSEAGRDAPARIELVSDAFESGASIPHRHAGEGVGENLSPPLAWRNIRATWPSSRS